MLPLSASSFLRAAGWLVLTMGVTSGPLRAAPVEATEIARLVQQLASKDTGEREAAGQRLEAIGEPALAALQKAAASADFETRLRASRLVEAILRRFELRRFEGHRQTVMSVALSPDGRHALSSGHDHTIRLWDLETGQEVRRFEGHTECVWCVVFSPDGRRALSGSGTHFAFGQVKDPTVRLWDVATGKELRRLPGHTKAVRGVAFSPDGRRALSGGEDWTLRLWDLESGQELRRFQGHTNHILSVAVSPDGRYGLSGSGVEERDGKGHPGTDNTVRLWDLETGQEVRRCEGHTHLVLSVVFAPDGRRALSGSWDETLRLWDLATGKELRRFTGHTEQIEKVAISADGRRAVSAGYDNSLRLWDVATGRELLCLKGHAGQVMSVALAPDGRRALSGSTDRTVRLWRLPELAAQAGQP